MKCNGKMEKGRYLMKHDDIVQEKKYCQISSSYIVRKKHYLIKPNCNLEEEHFLIKFSNWGLVKRLKKRSIA